MTDHWTFTDSAGNTARYTPIEDVKPGDAITEAWKPWPVVTAVEQSEDGRYRMLFGERPGGWVAPGTRIPVEVAE